MLLENSSRIGDMHFKVIDDCLFLFFDVFSMILLFIADNSFKYGTHKRI